MSRTQLAPGHAREYETIYILRPNLDKEEAEKVATYVYLKSPGQGATVSDLERQLRLLDGVIRYKTIVLQNNVKVAEVEVEAGSLELDFDLPYEPDEPELSREKELGLDAPPPERRRRDDRRERNEDDSDDNDDNSDNDDDSSDDSSEDEEE